MKKFLTLGLAALTLGFTGCKHQDSYETYNRPITAPAFSIITSLDNQEVVVKEGAYKFDLTITYSNNPSQTGIVTSPDLIADNTSLSFNTESQDYQSTGYDAYFANAQGSVAGNLSLPLKNADFLAAYLQDDNYNPYGYYYTTDEVGEYTFNLNALQYPWIAVAKFYLGDEYRVNTFPFDSFFKGTTTTTYPSAGTTNKYRTENITYRFMIDSKTMTAKMIMYNAKFSSVEREPVKWILVEGLTVDFTSDGVTIKGENIVPGMLESNGFTPNDNYIVNTLEFKTINDYYTTATLDFTVAGIYQGHFEGSYLKSLFIK